MLLLIALGRWELRIERHPEGSSLEPQGDREYVPQPMTVYTPDFVGFIPTPPEDAA